MKKEAYFYDQQADSSVICRACAHYCRIKPGNRGKCNVRENYEGKLICINYADIVSAALDPVEKKPLYHFLPGTGTFSIALPGCNFICGFCQNHSISQMSRSYSGNAGSTKPEETVAGALSENAGSISYTYSEPAVFIEYVLETASQAKEKGLKNILVTNGFFSDESREMLPGKIEAMNIDLKSFSERTYAVVMGGRLKPVLDNIKYFRKMGIWLELTTLIVPGLNDSEGEIEAIAGFIAETGKDIPWHISAFHPAYKYENIHFTPEETITKAVDIGKNAGLSFVYPGNSSIDSSTYCPVCKNLLIRRRGFKSAISGLTDGRCGSCMQEMPGVWK